MMRNIRNIKWMMILTVLGAIIFSCENEEAITYSVQDVSSKVTGFSNEVTGAGATLGINGSEMDKVVRVFIGNVVVTKFAFTEITPSNITFNVPLTVSLGENEVLIVYEGNGRATKNIEVVALPAISAFTPANVSQGEVVTIVGTNLGASFVTGVNIGGAAATIVSQSGSSLAFTVPAGFATNKITLDGPAGSVSSATNLTNCADDPNQVDCKAALNLNAGFESGAGNDFDNWGKWNGGTFMAATTVPGEYYRGTRGLKVVRDGSLGSGEWRIQLASDLVPTEAGASYTVYLWAKASVAGGSMRVSTNPDAKYTANQSITTSWQRLEFTFADGNAIQTTDTRVVLDLNGNNTAATTFFIDDVKLIKN